MPARTARRQQRAGRELVLDQAVRQPGQQLAVDAIGRFDLQTAIDYGNGYVTQPPLPGIGFEGKADLYAEMTRLTN